MRGDTTAVDVQTLRLQWASHSSMVDICAFWTISRDQLIRLRDVYELPKRHNRSLRFKPQRQTDDADSEEEEAKSQETLSLAPSIEQRAALVRAKWSESVRNERYWSAPMRFVVQQVDLPPDAELPVEE